MADFTIEEMSNEAPIPGSFKIVPIWRAGNQFEAAMVSQGTAAGCTAAAAGCAAVYASKYIISRYRSIRVLIYKSGLNTYIVRI
jgi:hypothetical protein